LKKSDVILSLQIWIKSFVVEYNICPFAKIAWVNHDIRIEVSEADTEKNLLNDLKTELEFLVNDETIETSILIHPYVLQEFYDYNEFLSDADSLLIEMQLEGIFQIASFHPEYQFSGTQPDDVENYTNRSPWPILHILREASVEQAVMSYPMVDQIPVRNIDLMKRLGRHKLQVIMKSCKKTS
jgi:hypothetical protein